MKKFFIALSVLAALMLSVVPSQALVGSPDNVPGQDAVVPFISDISGTSGLNTLIVLWDAGGGWIQGAAAAYADRLSTNFHYTVLTQASVTVFDGNLRGTTNDMVSTDAQTLLAAMSSAARTALLVDISGDGTNDHYGGYVYIEGVNGAAQAAANNTVGTFYFVDLAAGQVASANIPMKEYSVDVAGTATRVQPPFRNEMVKTAAAATDVNLELFSPNALLNAQRLQAGIATAANAANFFIYPRFYIPTATDVNWFMFWQSATGAHGGDVHCNVYDKDEVPLSTNIPLDLEWHVYDASRYLPAGLWTTYPHEGFVRLTYPTATAALRSLECIGWVYQAAFGDADQAWTVMNAMPRNVN
jgi:hypothetical protein